MLKSKPIRRKWIYWILLSLLITGCTSDSDPFKKYEIEKGILTYSLAHPLIENPVEKRVYFSNFGATEYFEFVHEESFPTLPILKIDSFEYVFVTDSMAISTPRTPMSIFERLTYQIGLDTAKTDLEISTRSDTVFDGKPCQLLEFTIASTGQHGKAIL